MPVDFALIALVCHVLLGTAAFLTNPRRSINRSFLALTLVIGCWILGIQLAFRASNAETAAFAIRWSSACGGMVPAVFALLQSSIIYHDEPWLKQPLRVKWWVISALLAAAFCFTPFYLFTVKFTPATAAGSRALIEPVFHPAVPMYYVYLAVTTIGIAVSMFRALHRSQVTGVIRVELEFVWLACMTIVLSVALALPLQYLLGAPLVRLAGAVRVILFDIIIAYGITSRGILQIRSVVRLTLSYLLLALYTGVIYGLAWLALRWLFLHADNDSPLWPSILAGGLSAMLVNSLGSPFRRFARHILPANDLDFERTFAKVRHLLQSVATLNELLHDFSEVLARAVGAPKVRVLLPCPGGFQEHDGDADDTLFSPATHPQVHLSAGDVIVQALRAGAPDLALEEFARLASSPQQRAVLSRLRELEADLVVPARHRGELSAIMLLSPRAGGRIYGGDGRSTLRLIAEQLAVAVVNAHLYTEAYRSQAYNRLLVEHLPCGVITTDPTGLVQVLNPEARRLLQVDDGVLPADIELPPSFIDLVDPTLRTQTESAPEEIVLRSGARDQANLRVNCLPLGGEHNELVGAVLVLNDHTTLERLQRAVRQADRLASIGTLASGMAHEIKNPLTALKTFTQLLPKRYNDAEFRHDFSGLAGSEIARIERIVNQLLAFARPAPLMIEQVNLHEIVNNAVKLVGPQASREHVAIKADLSAYPDYIAADKDRLQQVLLNLLLNAIQANGNGGWIELKSECEPGTAGHEPSIRLDVRDGGSGIPPDILPHIFDPFFTTKGEGTGLGLSVSYNIVAEHKGRLEVVSESGKGTCFSLYLPVC